MRTTWSWIKVHPWALVVILLAIYVIYSQLFNMAARHYFEQHCKNDAGEFIYKTVDNVEGVFQMRPRDPEDYFDNLRHYLKGRGKLLEDPFGHTNRESQEPETLFVSPPLENYYYFETTRKPNISDDRYPKTLLDKNYGINDNGGKYWIYRSLRHVGEKDIRSIYSIENTDELKSRYGFTWREVRDKWDKFFDIWGGELLVKDLKTDETLAIRRGYFSFKFGICPHDKNSEITYQFVSKVLKPSNQAGLDTQGEQ